MPDESWDQLLDLLAVAVCRKYGYFPESVTIRFRDFAKPLTVPIDNVVRRAIYAPVPQMPAAAATPATPLPAETSETAGWRPMSPIPGAILEALEQAGKPLSLTMLLLALDKTGKHFARVAIDKHLEQMLADGTIEHPEDRPKFYQLPTDSGRGSKPAGGPQAK